MEPWLAGLISGGIFISLLLFGVPVACGLGIVGLGLIVVSGTVASAAYLLPTAAFYHLASFALIALPLFILLSTFMQESGMGYELFEFALRWLGRIPGALAVASVLGCAGFAAISGSSVATAAAVGAIAIPEMKARNYSSRLAYGAVAAGGTMGILIPPSLQFILYGVLSDTNIGSLFIAGIVPRIIMTAVFSSYIAIACRLKPSLAPPSPPVTWSERFTSLKRMWTLLVLVGFVLGGIFSGVVETTEAAALGSTVALLLGCFYFKKLGLSNIRRACLQAVYASTMVGFIIVSALIFGRGLVLAGITSQLVTFIKELPFPPMVIIIAINILLLILGCFMDGAAITIVMTPLLAPIVKGLGLDLVWFGVVMCINIEVGLLTPPVGMNLFVITGITGDRFMEVVRGVLPFMMLQLFMLALIIVFPSISLWLPNLMP